MHGRGHTRPLLTFCLNLVSQYPALHITYLTTTSFLPSVQSEIWRYFGGTEITNRLRVIGLGPTTPKSGSTEDISTRLPLFFEHLPGALAPMLGSPADAEGFDRRPTLAITDVSIFFPLYRHL